MPKLNYKTTKEIKVSKELYETVIGQDEAVTIIKKAAKQRRNVLLIGESGTGKSLIGQALAQLLPKEKLIDILAFPNPQDENIPLIRTMPKGEGKKLITKAKIQAATSLKNQNMIMFIIIIVVSLIPYYFWKTGAISDVIYAASMISSMVFLIGFMLFMNLSKRMSLNNKQPVPKLLIDSSEQKQAPFYDGTGAHAGALLGDVLHDPLQSFSGNEVIMNPNTNLEKISVKIDRLFNKFKDKVIKKDNYEAIFLPKNELFILGELTGIIKPVEVLSVNRYISDQELIKIITESGKTLIITPEHKIAVNKNGKIQYITASKLKKSKEVYVKD